MKRVFSAWGKAKDRRPSVLVSGEEPPRFANGELQPDCERFFWRIEAATWEEAQAVYHLRQGWEPYRPQGTAGPCPECGELFYRNGSGQCWNCTYKC